MKQSSEVDFIVQLPWFTGPISHPWKIKSSLVSLVTDIVMNWPIRTIIPPSANMTCPSWVTIPREPCNSFVPSTLAPSIVKDLATGLGTTNAEA